MIGVVHYVRTPGPVKTVNGTNSAVWPGDDVTVLCRIGCRRLCSIRFGYHNRNQMIAIVPKQWLRIKRQSTLP